MALCNSSRAVVVLDLDDTLYPEVEYQTSGYFEVCRWIESIYGVSLVQHLKRIRESDEKDVLGALCELANLPHTIKESLLWIYRLHKPEITLPISSSQYIRKLRDRHNVAILTDGRSITQRQKLDALGLRDLPTYISEDYASEKPQLDRFKLIMTEIPGERYVYVGDNPKKDFVAPNHLGWVTFCLRGNKRNIHDQETLTLTASQMPTYWIDTLDETLNLIC